MKNLFRALAFVATLWVSSALAQTFPNWTFGFVPTPAQWNAAFAGKQDYLGATPVLTTGGIMSGALITAPSVLTSSGFNIPPGVPPTSPNNGDIWETSAGIFGQVNGVTIGPLIGGTQGPNTILGNASGTNVPSGLSIPSCSGAANAIQWVNNTGFQCGTIVAAASSIAVGSTTISGGSVGNIFSHGSGNLLAEFTTSGSGTVLALATGATIATATLTFATITAPVINGTITGTYTLGGTPSIAGSAINSGTVSGTFLSNINLAASGNGGVTGILGIVNGGSGSATQAGAIANLMPVPTRAGDIAVWSGTAWTTIAGNNSGTQILSENSSGVPAWTTVTGIGTVTSVLLAAGSGMSFSGTNPITSSGTITVNGAVPAPQGRITLAANTPVMGPTSCSGAACSNQTTLRYDCSAGAQVPYYNGTTDLLDTIASCEVTDGMVAAATAGQVVANNVYDVWWVHSGANRICVAMSAATGGGGGWSSDTGGSNVARGTGFSAIDPTTRGYPTNKNALTNCFNGATNYGSVSANQATYLGTVYASANGAVSFVFGTSVSGGGAAQLGVWNMHNRVDVKTVVSDSKATWTYASGTIRFVDASANNSIQFVSGLPVDGVYANYYITSAAAAAGGGTRCGFALDSPTTGPFDVSASAQQSGGTAALAPCGVASSYNPQVGVHTLSAYEAVFNAITQTFTGNTATGGQGLGFGLRM